MEKISLAIGLGFVISLLSVKALLRFGGLSHDVPNERSSHTAPTARGAGLAILLALIFGCSALYQLAIPVTESEQHALGLIFVTSVLIGAMGVLEDIRGLSVKLRFGIEAGLALLLALSGLRWDNWLPEGLAIALTVFWILWVINLYNFMDGINGIAIIQALAALVAYALISFQLHLTLGLGLILILAVSLLAILPYNFPKAQIFLGDSGSLLLGFLFAALPLMIHGQDRNFTLLHGIVAIFPFFVDALLTLGRRILMKENILKAHRSHCYQILAQRWNGHTQVTIVYGALGFYAGACLGCHRWLGTNLTLLLFVPYAVAVVSVFFWIQLRYSHQSLTCNPHAGGIQSGRKAEHAN